MINGVKCRFRYSKLHSKVVDYLINQTKSIQKTKPNQRETHVKGAARPQSVNAKKKTKIRGVCVYV